MRANGHKNSNSVVIVQDNAGRSSWRRRSRQIAEDVETAERVAAAEQRAALDRARELLAAAELILGRHLGGNEEVLRRAVNLFLATA